MNQTKNMTLRDEVLQSLMKYASTLRQLGMNEQAELMDAKIVEYTQGMFQVMFTGPFSAGKSTTLNALTRRELLKTSIKPETAVLAKIVNGKNSDMVTVTYRDPNRADTVMAYDKFKAEFRLDEKDSDKFKEIAYVTVTNEMYNPAVAFVDSPGLDHTETDNEISNTFANKADAIVMVLSAAKLGSDGERKYIQERFAGRGLKNVFFVINWYNILKPEDEEAFPEQLLNLIGCAFTDAEGNFNEDLYNQRVFPVDAYTSECARTGKKKQEKKGIKFIEYSVAPEEDEFTGIPDFERALTEFLDSPEKEKAAFEIYLPQLGRYYSSAKNLIDDFAKKSAMSLEELLKEQKKQEEEIKKLENVINGIQHSYDNAMREIMMNISTGYDDFARSVENNWEDHFSSIAIPFGFKETSKLAYLKGKYAVGDLFKKIKGGRHDSDSLAEDPEFKRITQPIGHAIKAYMESEGDKMKDAILASSQSAIVRLEQDLNHYVQQLEEIDLTGIDLSAFGIETDVNDDELSKKANIAQVILVLLMGGNWDQAFKGLTNGGQSWGEFLKDFIATELIEVLIASLIQFVIGPVGWLYLLARAVWGIWKSSSNADSMGKKIVMGSKTSVVDAIKDQRDSQVFEIQQKYNKVIRKNGETVSKGFKASLKQMQENLKLLIEDKQRNEQESQQELNRMTELKQTLFNHFNDLAQLIWDKNCDEAEIIACGVKEAK